MANSKQAEKRVRQNEALRLHNRGLRSAMRTAVRIVREACEAGEKDKAEASLPLAMKRIDKCAKRNIIHRNNAARKKSALHSLVSSVG